MNKLLLYFFFIAVSVTAAAQNKKLDSLLKSADAEKIDSNRLKTYNRIGDYYLDNNPGKAIEYFLKVQELAKQLDKKRAIANSYYDIGYCYLNKADYDKSLENYLVAARMYEEQKDSFRLSNAFMSIGNLYGQNSNFKKSEEYYNKSQLLIEAIKDSLQLSRILSQKGTLYDQYKQYDTALIFLKRSYQIGLLIKEDYTIVYALSNIGLTYKHQGKTAEALTYFDSVLIMLKKMDAPVDDLASAYNNIGATQVQAGNYAKAKEAFDKSVELAMKSGSTSIVMENYRNMSDMFGDMKNFEMQAGYLKKYFGMKDSLFNADSKNQLTELESEYQLEKKNTEIVKKDAEVVQQRSARNIFIIIALATILLLAALAIFYRRIKINNRLLQEKNEQINKQKNELETLNQVKDRLFSIISHDLRNPLVTLRSYLSLVEDSTIPAEKRLLFKNHTMNAVIHTSDMLDNLLTWANMQIKNTAPAIIALNLEECIQDVIDNVQAQAAQKQISIQQEINAIAAPGDYNIFSIALRNLLTNAIKYSHAGQGIKISTEKKDDHILVSVNDEGTGLTKAQIQQIMSDQNSSSIGTGGEKGTGLGLFLVKQLLQKINATLEIESEEGKGSTFTIKLPAL
ncbi:MAG: tetratricopeptide repeat-containing sensor histidine kinase [Ferruginibacter sp.]